MTYLEQALAHDEEISYRAQYHWWWNVRSFGLLNYFGQIVVTDRRVFKKTGIFNVKTQSLMFRNLESMALNRSLWGRIVGYGDVILYGTGGQSENFSGLACPNAFLRAIEVASSKNIKRGINSAGAGN